MACASQAARCISSMKSATRDRSSFKPWCRYFPTIARSCWRRAFSSRNIGSIRARFNFMPRADCTWWDAESWLIALPKTSRKRSFSHRWTNEESEARFRPRPQTGRQRGIAGLFSRAYPHRTLSADFCEREIFLHRFGNVGLSLYPRHQRGTLDGLGPAGRHQDAVYGYAALLFDRHVL